jgi:UDP-N-acetylmuramyl pentapeptide phosphotransferase/UDP-N-acetylglucosamine-1-phosphate transferase
MQNFMKNSNASSGIYGLAFIGAAIYYIQNATNFLEGIFGLLKALVWPAILIYQALEFLNR